MHLNPVGDVVAYDGVGEVVLLPHLWDFDLLTVGKFIVLRASGNDLGDGKSGDGNSGMTAVLGFEQARDRLRRTFSGYTGPLRRVDLTRLLPLTYAVVVFFAAFTVWLLGADLVNPIRISS